MKMQSVLSKGFRRVGVEGWMYRLPRYYDRVMASELHSVRTKATRYLLDALETDRVGTVLDLACGTGITSVELAESLPDARVVGVDPTAKMLGLAERRARAHGVGERCSFLLQDAESITPEQVGTVDLVTCFFGFSVIDRWRGAFENSSRLVAAGGTYAIFDYHQEGLYISDFAADQSRESWKLVEETFADHDIQRFEGGFFLAIGRG